MANNELLASDAFSSGSLAAGWSAAGAEVTDVCQVVAGTPNVTEPKALTNVYGQLWTALGALENQISEVTSQALTVESNTAVFLVVRQQSGNQSRYQAQITDGTAAIYRNDNGTNTQLGSTVSGLTFAAGDVWTMVADGANVALYQNGHRIISVMDATYASGYPGYLQWSTVNVSHTQVSSWRGYSCVQQNGIWQKQGVIVPPLAGDLSSSGLGACNNSQILYEGNAQILSGMVYKMWFSVGGSTTGAIAYAESTDGINWTRRGTNVLSGWQFPSVFKSGSTYYMYVQPMASLGSGDFALYTSTDGVTWTQQSTTVLGLGTSGAWDSGFIFFFTPVAIINGTWYALYTGGQSGGQSNVGLAMSSDGVTWAKYASNPVIDATPAVWNSSAIVNVNGTYYLWAETSVAGQASSLTGDPTDTVRYQSTDLIHWSKSSPPGLWHAQLSEGLNSLVGQCVPNSIIDIGGKAYLYTTSSAVDAPGPSQFQISLAIAPAPTASIVLANEDGAEEVASDGFTGGTGNLSANWTTISSGNKLQIVAGNLTQPSSTSTNCGALYTGASFDGNQYSEITLHVLATTCYANPIVLANASALTWYEADISGALASRNNTPATGAAGIYRRVAGVAIQIGPIVPYTPQAGDVWRLSVVQLPVGNGGGNANVLSLFQNGCLVLQCVDLSASGPTSGSPGFLQYAITSPSNSQVSSWAGGNAGVTPSYDNLALPFLGSCSETLDDSPGTQYIGHVKVIGAPRAGVPNPYLGKLYKVSSPASGPGDPLLGEVAIVSGPPEGFTGTDSYLGHIEES